MRFIHCGQERITPTHCIVDTPKLGVSTILPFQGRCHDSDRGFSFKHFLEMEH